jgi:ABC-type nickel/cobalt efflux system permease component RcnA
MDVSLTAALGLGFLLGLRHALDPDHVAAVSARVTQERTVLSSCLLGTFWGAGHTVALLAAAVVMVAFKLTIPPEIERGLELVVAAVLVLLGGQVLLRCLAGVFHTHAHAHGGQVHDHLHAHRRPAGASAETPHQHRHLALRRLGGRPFLLGVVHGMAGSAGLMLLTLAAIPSAVGALVYVLVFGLGSTFGMLVLSGLMGVPLALSAGRSRVAEQVLQALTGSASLVLGLWIAYGLTMS